jgi:hypothetical protein
VLPARSADGLELSKQPELEIEAHIFADFDPDGPPPIKAMEAAIFTTTTVAVSQR